MDQDFNDGVEAMGQTVIRELHERLKMTEAFDLETLTWIIDKLVMETRR